ncbi:MAG: hypothetical protein ACTSVV_00870, partial [Promethearchaeota archaeon]
FELVILFIGFGILGWGTFEFFRRLIEYREQNHLQLIFLSVAVFINIILNCFLIKELGIMGASISTFIGYLTIVIFSNFYLKMDLNLNYITRVLRIIVGGIGLSIWLYLNKVNNIPDFFINIVVGGVIYSTIVLLLRVFKFKDIKKQFA